MPSAIARQIVPAQTEAVRAVPRKPLNLSHSPFAEYSERKRTEQPEQRLAQHQHSNRKSQGRPKRQLRCLPVSFAQSGCIAYRVKFRELGTKHRSNGKIHKPRKRDGPNRGVVNRYLIGTHKGLQHQDIRVQKQRGKAFEQQ